MSISLKQLLALVGKLDDSTGEGTAREMLQNQGGGELTTMGRDGKIRSKDTIPPGKDPYPPRGTEH
jgi:hypothetical protein